MHRSTVAYRSIQYRRALKIVGFWRENESNRSTTITLCGLYKGVYGMGLTKNDARTKEIKQQKLQTKVVKAGTQIAVLINMITEEKGGKQPSADSTTCMGAGHSLQWCAQCKSDPER